MPVYKYKLRGKTQFYIKVNIYGKQICKRGFTTKNEALIFEASMLKKNNIKKLKSFYVKELFNPYCELIKNKIKITSATSKIQVLNKHIFPFFENMKIKDINSNYLIYVAGSINKKKYKKKDYLFALLKEFLEYLMNFGLDRDLNMSMLYAKYNSRMDIVEFDYYTREEFNKFLSVVESPKYRLIFILLFDYGLRIGELLGLKHYDFTKTKVRIRRAIATKLGCGQLEIKPKSKSSIREYPLIDSVRVAYLNYVKSLNNCFNSTDYLFSAEDSKKLTLGESPIRNAQKKYEKLSKMRHIKIHEFRHSCASELINNGFTPEQVASWLGHASSEITMSTYFHLFPSRKLAIASYYNKLQGGENVSKSSENSYQIVSRKF